MARGDIYRLSLSGKGVVADASWVPGALASQFPVDVASVTRPVGTEMQAVVRLRSDAPVKFEQQVLQAGSVFDVPGMEPPRATVKSAEKIGATAMRQVTPTWVTNEVKWLGAFALIGVTALFASRIKQGT